MGTRSRDAAWLRSLFALGSKALVVLVVVEFLLLRVVNRMSGVLPAGFRGEAASDVVLAGTFAYNGAYLLALLLITVAAVVLRDRDPWFSLLLFVLVPAALAAQAFGSTSPAVVALAGVVAAVAMVAAVVRTLRRPVATVLPSGRGRFPFLGSRFAVALFVVAAAATSLAAMYAHVGDAFANVGVPPLGRAEVYAAGEGAAVLAAFLAFAAFWTGPSWRSLALAAVGAAALAAPLLFRPELIPLIAYWSVGFRMDLPFGIYVAALAAFLYALGAAWGVARRNPLWLYALVLLGLAGRQLADFYAVSIAVVALLFLMLGHGWPALGVLPSTAGSGERLSVPSRSRSGDAHGSAK